MTKTQQENVIKHFKDGEVNIIVATTVAEEGLDISECNYVIRYDVKGNEISFVQSRGRIRAKGGTYVHLSDSKSKGAEHERRNDYREMLMGLAVDEVQHIITEEFLNKVKDVYIIKFTLPLQPRSRYDSVARKTSRGNVMTCTGSQTNPLS